MIAPRQDMAVQAAQEARNAHLDELKKKDRADWVEQPVVEECIKSMAFLTHVCTSVAPALVQGGFPKQICSLFRTRQDTV